MPPKSQKAANTYVNLDDDAMKSIVLASSGIVKSKKSEAGQQETKEVDTRRIVGSIHIKKYLAGKKINGKEEVWIAALKKAIKLESGGEGVATEDEEAGEGEESEEVEADDSHELTADEVDAIEECKVATAKYLEEGGSKALKDKVAASSDELVNLKNITSSMKYKFSSFAYESVTHAVNLMIREILVATCDNCAAHKAKTTKEAYIPWASLQTKMMSGLYMNNLSVINSIHKGSVDPKAAKAESTEAPAEGETVDEPVVPAPKVRLAQYISNTFKEIVSREERFKGLLLGRDVTALVDKIVYETLDKYANLIKNFLECKKSKTVTEHDASLSTKSMLQSHPFHVDEDVDAVIDVIDARISELMAEASEKASKKASEKEAEAVAEPVKPSAKKPAKK